MEIGSEYKAGARKYHVRVRDLSLYILDPNKKKNSMGYTFEQFYSELSAQLKPGDTSLGEQRKACFEREPQRFQDEAWLALRRRIEQERRASEPKRQGTDWREVDQRLRQIEAADYVERISGREVRGRIGCPLPDHDDHSRDFCVRDLLWYCFGCGHGGTIYDFAAYYWGRGMRGEEFKTVQRELADLFGVL